LASRSIRATNYFNVRLSIEGVEEKQALAAFGALSQETRLRIVRLLVQAGPEGVAAGVLGEATGVSASNVSFHLKELERAGLIGARRQARSIKYAADYPALAGLLQFLMEDCCAGRPEICAPALANPCAPRATQPVDG
jgi:ArsR family transcriptional regulator, arsenate/arsenite/antimonite-responsive transcriptional repressor